MTDKEVLSQDEVDALVKGVDHGEVAVLPEDGNNVRAIEAVDFHKQKRIIRGQFPVLERIHERFSHNFSEGLYHILSKEVEINPQELKTEKFSEFFASLKHPAAISFYRFQPLRGKAMVIFDSDLVNTFVEKYFGGTGQFTTILDEREFTNTELRIVNLILAQLQKDLEAAWKPILEINLSYLNLETNPQLANSNSSDDIILVTSFDCQFGGDLSRFYIAIPYNMVEPIWDMLSIGGVRCEEDIDQNWVKSLKDSVLSVAISTRSILAKKQLSLRHVSALHAGEVVPLDIPDFVTLDIEGVPAFVASFGQSNEKLAVKIEHKIER